MEITRTAVQSTARKPNVDNAKVDELPNDNAIMNRNNLKLLSSPKLYGNRDGVETNGFMLIDFKGRPFNHNRENSLVGCEVPTHLVFLYSICSSCSYLL